MKITKFEHACIQIDKDGTRLVIDPGLYSKSFVDHENINTVVITHAHADHLDETTLMSIVKNNPLVDIYSTTEVTEKSKNFTIRSVSSGDQVVSAGFKLDFFGGKHALIFGDMPDAQNVGVLVDDVFYYPGDSFSIPEGANPTVLATPISGPWMKIGEAMAFVSQVKPRLVIPTHNEHNSEAGNQLIDNLLGNLCANQSTDYKHLKAGESVDV